MVSRTTKMGPYSVAAMVLLMCMLAMAAVAAALGLFASPAGAREVPFECPEGTAQAAEREDTCADPLP